jgi:hypothetical protein
MNGLADAYEAEGRLDEALVLDKQLHEQAT